MASDPANQSSPPPGSGSQNVDASDDALRAEPLQDASFDDAFRPTKLMAQDPDDLQVFSALLQDAVVLVKETAWLKAERRFAFIANRYRWEEPDMRERIRTGVHFDNVSSVQFRGVDLSAGDAPIVLLSASFKPGPNAPSGAVVIACAGGGDIQIQVEAIEAAMADVTKPWKAQRAPRHAAGGPR